MHSQRFYIFGHSGGISSVACCLWAANTQCVFSTRMPRNQGKYQNVTWKWSRALRNTLKKFIIFLFSLAEPEVCSLNWEQFLLWFRKRITQNMTENAHTCTHKNKKQNKKNLLCHKVWRSSGSFSAQGWGGGGVASFRWNSEGNWKQSPAIWFLIFSLPWQCKSDTVSE